MKIPVYLLILIIFGCTTVKPEDQIFCTTKKFLYETSNRNFFDVRKLIGSDLEDIGRSEKLLMMDIDKLSIFLNRYKTIQTPQIIITDDYSFIGRRMVKVNIFDGIDTINNVSKIELKLFFGPPEIVPFNKVASYEIFFRPVKAVLIDPAPF